MEKETTNIFTGERISEEKGPTKMNDYYLEKIYRGYFDVDTIDNDNDNRYLQENRYKDYGDMEDMAYDRMRDLELNRRD